MSNPSFENGRPATVVVSGSRGCPGPALVALSPASCAGPNTTDIENDALAPARGIVIGLLLAAPVWTGIGALAWLLMR